MDVRAELQKYWEEHSAYSPFERLLEALWWHSEMEGFETLEEEDTFNDIYNNLRQEVLDGGAYESK